jgi:replicative superfamily II helicase
MRIDLLEAFGLDPNVIAILKQKYGAQLLPIQERAVKKAIMMNRWISKAETKEIENSYQVFSGAIKRVGEDFSWLAETLASLAKEIRWDQRAIARISNLSQRLIYGVTEKGLALSSIRLRGLTMFNCRCNNCNGMLF